MHTSKMVVTDLEDGETLMVRGPNGRGITLAVDLDRSGSLILDDVGQYDSVLAGPTGQDEGTDCVVGVTEPGEEFLEAEHIHTIFLK